jgi:hypothetical protein
VARTWAIWAAMSEPWLSGETPRTIEAWTESAALGAAVLGGAMSCGAAPGARRRPPLLWQSRCLGFDQDQESNIQIMQLTSGEEKREQRAKSF